MLDAADEIVDIAADAAALKRRRRSRSPPPPPISPALPTSLPQSRPTGRRGQKPETKDEESLDVWLTRQSPQVAAAIARGSIALGAVRGSTGAERAERERRLRVPRFDKRGLARHRAGAGRRQISEPCQ